MAKRPDSIETALLAIELLRRIPRGRKVTAKELHQQLADAGLNRDLRTIQRQLELLSEHFDIERDDRSKPYGYSWLSESSGFTLPNLTSQESLLLALAEEHLRYLLPSRLMKAMNGFFVQAKRNLGTGSKATLEREWAGKVRVVATRQPLLPPKIASGIFATVSEALYENRWLVVRYLNAAGKESSAKVMPLGLTQQGPRMYLVCRYEGYDNERNLALHRMVSAEASSVTFERPKNFNLKQYDDDGRFGYGEGKRIRLQFRIAKMDGQHLLETPLSTDQQVVALADGYEITASVVDSLMLTWWLRGFGDAVSDVRRTPLDRISG